MVLMKLHIISIIMMGIALISIKKIYNNNMTKDKLLII